MTSPAKKPKTSTERMREHRRRMREKGFVQKTIWVPDFSNPAVLADYQRQAEKLGAMEMSDDDRAWLAHSEQMLSDAWAEDKK